MAKGNSCILTPEVGGKPSKLYTDLVKKLGNRPLANYIYAAYLQPGVAALMDNNGKRRDKLGQHNAIDVMELFEAHKMQAEVAKGISQIAETVGAIDSAGHLVDFDDASTALGVATRVNANYKGVVAYVTPHNDKFNIHVVQRDGKTQQFIATERAKVETWDALKQAFTAIGIDLDNSNIDPGLANANRGEEFVSWLRNTQRVRSSLNHTLSLRDIRGLFAISENTTQVQRLITMFGSLDAAVQAAYDSFRVRGAVTAAQSALINSTLDNCKNYNGLALTDLLDRVDEINETKVNSTESAIQQTIQSLDAQYNINKEEHDNVANMLRSLSDVADEAIVTLQRQFEQTRAELGKYSDEAKILKREFDALSRAISSKKYYNGMLGFMTEAVKQVQKIYTDVHTVTAATTTWAQLRDACAIAQRFKNMYLGYSNILAALADIDSLLIEEIIDDADKANLASMAAQTAKILEETKEYLNGIPYKKSGIMQGVMIDLCSAILGDKLSNGVATATFVTAAQADSTLQDRFLYSVGRMSNPMINAMGSIIQEARHNYDAKIQEYSKRIRIAERKLRQAGYTSEFMYDEDGNIISDINWAAYRNAWTSAKAAARSMGLKGLDLEEYMLNWEEANLEDRVVDWSPGHPRTEKVPNSNYRKAFPRLSPAQQEYYDEMMQLKGELGSLLPSYAQKHFLPPQVRRGFWDAIIATIQGKNGKFFPGLVRTIMNKIRDIYTIREDDTNFAGNGIINGEEMGLTSGTLGNTPFRQIPIFFVNKIQDQRELLKDFSGAMQSFMQTAVHFEMMNNVRDVLEFMGDYIREATPGARKRDQNLAERVVTEEVDIYKRLIKFGRNSNTEAIIEGMLDWHLYGVKVKNQSKYTKALLSLLQYNSIRNLTVNLKGMISNYVVGLLQMIIESGASEFYNIKDLGWAFLQVAGDNGIDLKNPVSGIQRTTQRVIDLATNNLNSLPGLLGQRFDPLPETATEQGHKRYYGVLRNLLSVDLTFLGYGAGEHMIHYMNMYAVLHHKKVHLNGKTVPLFDIFYVNQTDATSNALGLTYGNSELGYDHNATYTDENGNEVPVDEAYLDKVKDEIKYVNQTTHGSMNDMDKGLIHQYIVGRFIMNLRQWMVEHYSRRFRSEHRDANLKRNVEGYWTTVLRLISTYAREALHLQNEAALHWEELSTHQKSNVRRALSEVFVLGCLWALQAGLGAPEDHKGEFWYRMWIYQVKRAIVDVNGSTPWGIPAEMNTLLNSPISATHTVNAMLYPFTGLGDIGTKIQRGPDKGQDKYLRNLEKYWFPFVKHFKQMNAFAEDEGVFKIYDKTDLQ